MKCKLEVFRSTTFCYAVIIDSHCNSCLLHHFICVDKDQVLLLENIVPDCNVRRMIYNTIIWKVQTSKVYTMLLNTVTFNQNYCSTWRPIIFTIIANKVYFRSIIIFILVYLHNGESLFTYCNNYGDFHGQ